MWAMELLVLSGFAGESLLIRAGKRLTGCHCFGICSIGAGIAIPAAWSYGSPCLISNKKRAIGARYASCSSDCCQTACIFHRPQLIYLWRQILNKAGWHRRRWSCWGRCWGCSPRSSGTAAYALGSAVGRACCFTPILRILCRCSISHETLSMRLLANLCRGSVWVKRRRLDEMNGR